MKILLRDFNAKLRRENIFKPTFGNESLHQGSYDNGVTIVNFATPKSLGVNGTKLPHRDIHKYTWTSLDGAFVIWTGSCWLRIGAGGGHL